MSQDTPAGLSAKVGRLRLLNIVLLSLNMGYALASALRTYLDVPRGEWLAVLLYGSPIHFFHHNDWRYFAVAEVFVGTMLLMATTVLIVVLLCVRYSSPSFAKFLAGPLSCLLALAAMPTFWIASIQIGWPPFHFWDTYPDWLGGRGFGTLAAEVIFVLALLIGHSTSTGSVPV
jgi:hypothetical protein